MSLQAGIYQHYKGQLYQVYRTVRHSETEEVLVYYQCLYGDYSYWVRPLTMFTEQVLNSEGQKVPRFKLIQAL
jgi:hypothetical protein